MIRELDSVVLTEDLPEHGLQRGDIGTVVLVHRDGAGYEVEFVALDRATLAVVSLHPHQLRPAAHGEIAQLRAAADDPLFLADLREVAEDFQHADASAPVPRDLYGIWRGSVPEDFDAESAIREVRQEWTSELDESEP